MRHIKYLLVVLLVLSIVLCLISCKTNLAAQVKDSSKDELQTRNSKDDVSKMLLTGYSFDEDEFYIQTVNLKKKNDEMIGKIQVVEDIDNGFNDDELMVAGIIDNYVCLQKKGKTTYSKEKGGNYSYWLKLYDFDNFDVAKPEFEKKFDGYHGTAFYTIGNQIYIGSKGELRLATIDKDDISMEYLIKRDYYTKKQYWELSDKERKLKFFSEKSIDVFTTFGDYLLAIDDVVRPYYAFLYKYDDESKPEMVATLDMPTYINLHYMDAVGEDDIVYTLASYGHRSGEGQIIYALKYKDKKFEIKYLYNGAISAGINDKEEQLGKYYPNLNDLYLYKDKLFCAGMCCIVEMNKNPETKDEPDEDEFPPIASSSSYGIPQDTEFKPRYAKDKVKLHEFDGVITSIAVVGDKLYALQRHYEKILLGYDYESHKSKIKKVELLCLSYDAEKGEFKELSKTEVDKRVERIVINKK